MKHLLLAASVLLLSLLSYAQVDTDIELIEFASGFDKPVDIANAGDARLFIVEKDGQIRILNSDGTINATPFLNMQSLTSTGGTSSEQGLLGLEFHPNYADNGFFYVNYTRGNGDTRISRFSVSTDPNIADINSREDIITIDQPYGNHNGGCLKFGPDGYLYIGMGDGGSGEDPQGYGQNMNAFLGKILRLDVSVLPYVVPAENPFVDAVSDTLPEIWASGIRNPWRFAFDSQTGDLWIADVGQYTWEEIDFQPAASTGGENYGWRCYEGNHSGFGSGCPPMTDFTAAVAEFNHNAGHCSITGGQVYHGAGYPALGDKYYSVDYCSGQFWSTEIADDNSFVTFQVSGQEGFGWTDMDVDVHGEMYVSNQGGQSDNTGTIYQIIDASCAGTQAEISTVDGLTLSATEGLAYQWFNNGEAIPGATSQEYTATTGGLYAVFVQFAEGCADYSAYTQVIISGLEEQAAHHGLSLSQNPVNNQLTIRFNRALDRGADLRIHDAAGRLVLNTAINGGSTDWTADVSQFAVGQYTLHISDEQGRSVVRFAIMR